MSEGHTRRGAARLRLITIVALAITLGAGLAPVALAADETPASEETSTADDPKPADDATRQNRLNPNVSGKLRNLNPMTAPADGPAPADEPAADPVAEPAAAEDPPAEDASEDTVDSEPAADDDPAETAVRAARQTAGDRVASGNNNQPVAVNHAAGGGEPATTVGGGSAGAAGDGGTIILSAGITGNNRGSEINVQDCAYGSVQIDGGTIVNATGISLSADGGTAVSTANGGDDNVVQAGGAVASRIISTGNGGAAGSDANGGTIITGAMITGNNRGHEVNFADCPGGRGNATLMIDAGDISNTTTIDISADGGAAIADASGGSGNLGITGGLGGAAAGNGGVADSAANGGTIITGAMITGNNRGNTITVGHAAGDGTTTAGGSGASGAGSCVGGPVSVVIDGGNISNNTSIDISADGGAAIGDASGGDSNFGFGGDSAAGNGGVANTNANGGTIITNAMITGNNRGNSISLGNVTGCAPAATPNLDASRHLAAPRHDAIPLAATAPKQVTHTGTTGKSVLVRSLPNTGTGHLAGAISGSPLLPLVLVAGLGAGLLLAGPRGDSGLLPSSIKGVFLAEPAPRGIWPRIARQTASVRFSRW